MDAQVFDANASQAHLSCCDEVLSECFATKHAGYRPMAPSLSHIGFFSVELGEWQSGLD